MTDRPILFSGPMVRALLDGRKSMTRRVLKPPYGTLEYLPDGTWKPIYTKAFPGDRLWVREAHRLTDDGYEECVVYEADENDVQDHIEGIKRIQRQCNLSDEWAAPHLRKRPSIHMPRWASRLTLTVTDVRVQRVQEISEADARAEGIERLKSGRGFYDPTQSKGAVHLGSYFNRASDAFCTLWDSLNAKRGHGWDENPWVVAISFDVHRCNIDQMEDQQ